VRTNTIPQNDTPGDADWIVREVCMYVLSGKDSRGVSYAEDVTRYSSTALVRGLLGSVCSVLLLPKFHDTGIGMFIPGTGAGLPGAMLGPQKVAFENPV